MQSAHISPVLFAAQAQAALIEDSEIGAKQAAGGAAAGAAGEAKVEHKGRFVLTEEAEDAA